MGFILDDNEKGSDYSQKVFLKMIMNNIWLPYSISLESRMVKTLNRLPIGGLIRRKICELLSKLGIIDALVTACPVCKKIGYIDCHSIPSPTCGKAECEDFVLEQSIQNRDTSKWSE